MHRAAGAAQGNLPPGQLPVHDAEPAFQGSALFPRFTAPSPEAVPYQCNQLFEEMKHGGIVWGGVTRTVTRRGEKNPGGRRVRPPGGDDGGRAAIPLRRGSPSLLEGTHRTQPNILG